MDNGLLTLNADGSFGYEPDANFNGDDTFTYKANDGSADSEAATVTITVNAVNDAPSFTVGGNVSVAEDSGAYSAPWATGISKGPADESSQTLTFQVTGNTNTALFSSGPSITDDGTLSFTPAANASGSATITVVLKDDGGTANDGQDTSSSVTFTITVNALNDLPALTTNAGLTLNEGATAIINNNRLNVNDIDNPAAHLVYTLDAVTTNGTLKKNGTPLSAGGTFTQADINAGLLTYEHNGSETTSDNFGFTVADGAGGTISSTTFTITVTPLNDPPTITVAAGGSCSTTNVSGTMNLTLADVDSPVGSLTLSATSSNTSLVPNANITLGGSGANRTVTITPAAKKSGSATITITVDDRAATSSTTITVIVGTDKKETIKGTTHADMIFGLNGDDTIGAGDGIDLACGGNGGGVISGGAGDDTLDGGNGNDTLKGEGGSDILRGSQGSDRLEGGDNDDTLTGGMGADSFIGGAGTDVATDFKAAEGDTKDATIP